MSIKNGVHLIIEVGWMDRGNHLRRNCFGVVVPEVPRMGLIATFHQERHVEEQSPHRDSHNGTCISECTAAIPLLGSWQKLSVMSKELRIQGRSASVLATNPSIRCTCRQKYSWMMRSHCSFWSLLSTNNQVSGTHPNQDRWHNVSGNLNTSSKFPQIWPFRSDLPS